MSDNYTQFSGIFTHLTADEERWLRHALRSVGEQLIASDDEETIKALVEAEPWRDEDNPDLDPDFQFNFGADKEDGSYLHMYAEESGNAWAAGQLAHAFLKQFRPTDIWSTNWAATCNKMRVDEFGGGAVVVTAQEVRALDSYSWVEHMKKHFKRTGTLPVVRKVKRYKPSRFTGMGERAIADETGWSDATLRQLMHDFIDENNLTERYAAYLAYRAREEEKAAKSL